MKFSADFSPDSEGTCTIDINSSKFTDITGNDNNASTQFSWISDTTAPTISAFDTSNYSWGDVLNLNESNTNQVVTVNTSGVEDGQTLTLTLDHTISIWRNDLKIRIQK